MNARRRPWSLAFSKQLVRPVQIGTSLRYRPQLERLESRLAPAVHDTLITALSLPVDSSQPAQVSGLLAAVNQVDLYAVLLHAGDQITADVTSQTLGTPGSCLRLFDSGGRQLAFQENTGSTDTTLVFVAPLGGRYYVGVSSNGDVSYDPTTSNSGSGGVTTGSYSLTLKLSSVLVLESLANGLPTNVALASAQPLGGNTVLQGTYVSGSTEYYSFTVTTHAALSATVTPADGSSFVPRLSLLDASGQLLTQSYLPTSGHIAAQLEQQLQAGTYCLAVSAIAAKGNPAYVLDTALTPTLPPLQPLPGVDHPYGLAEGDFNHDGNLDIVTGNAGGKSVSVLLGHGDGTFLPAATYPVGENCLSVALADFNHDGNLDIVGTTEGPGDPVTHTNTNHVAVLLGRGDGTFLPAVTYIVGVGPDDVAVGDFNHDGNLDLATANAGGSISVLLGRGDGTFLPAATYTMGFAPNSLFAPFSIAAGDFNHDGNLDLVTDNFDGTVSVLLGRGDGTFLPLATYKGAGLSNFLRVGDVDHDGNLDIILFGGAASGQLWVLQGRGDGTFLPVASQTVSYNFSYNLGVTDSFVFLVGDYNHDGYPDLVTAATNGNTVTVSLGRAEGTFLQESSYTAGSGAGSMATGDFNRDGNLDLVTINVGDNPVSVLLGRGDGTFSQAASYAGGSYPNAVAVGDFNHDGNLDLVTANVGDNTVSVLLGRGDGTFLPAANFTVGLYPYWVAVGDFNHDGNLDLVAANTGDSTVSVLLGRGDGTFLPAASYAVGSGPYSVAVGDFNHDGNLDLATANWGNYDPATGNLDNKVSVSVLLGQGDGTFVLGSSYAVGSLPQNLAVGDFNHDGNLDLVTPIYDYVSGANVVEVLLGHGDGTFWPPVSYPVGALTNAVAVGDFNHDGNLDIVNTNSDLANGFLADNTVSVLLGRGDGTFLPAANFTVGYYAAFVAVGDFNHDGNPDLVTLANTAPVLLGKGNAQFETSTPAKGIAQRDIPYLQDLTGDGIPDLLIRNSAGDLLFRQGLGPVDQFAPPVILNPGYPTRDATVFHTAQGWAVAAVDDAGNTASIYTWDRATRSFRRSVGFATGNLPVRIAAADFTGAGRDDLVVANGFDDSVMIGLQNSDGTFTTITQPTGTAPSDITFVHEAGQSQPDIAVSDEVSGDVTVLVNDSFGGSLPTFAQEYRYRAGNALIDVNIDPSTGTPTVLSQLQTVALAAGNWSGTGSDDLLTLNRGAKSFTLLPNQGHGSFPTPQWANTYFPISDQPNQVAPITLPGDTLPSVAILMQDRSQIWIYRNQGNGTFGEPFRVNAGNDPTGFSVARVNGTLALLVGNKYGDVLTLLYQDHRSPPPNFVGPVSNASGFDFVPDRANLHNAPLAVGTIAATGQQFAIVANQGNDQVALYYRLPGTDAFRTPLSISGTSPLPVLAPGAVQTFTVPGDPNPYLVVANSLSNNVLLYHFTPDTGQFAALGSLPVGDNPVSITVADVNDDKVPDLLVANQGSNDVSVLIGARVGGLWTATAYQRLNSDGAGPLAVAVLPTNSTNGPNLLVTNSDGKVVVLPGIGTGGTGSGFFQDSNPQTFDLGRAIAQSVFDAATGQLFLVGRDGSLNLLNGDSFVTLVARGVTTLDAADAVLAAGFDNGSIGLLATDGTLLANEQTEFTDVPSALQVLRDGNRLDVFATQQGSDVPIIVSFVIPVVTELPAVAPVAEATKVQGPELVLVATLLSGELVDNVPSNPSAPVVAVPGVEVFAVFVPAVAGGTAGSGGEEGVVVAPVVAPAPEAAVGQSFPAGVNEALQQHIEQQRLNRQFERLLDSVQDYLRGWGEMLPPPLLWPRLSQLAAPLEPAPRLAVVLPAPAEAATSDPIWESPLADATPAEGDARTATTADWQAAVAVCLAGAVWNGAGTNVLPDTRQRRRRPPSRAGGQEASARGVASPARMTATHGPQHTPLAASMAIPWHRSFGMERTSERQGPRPIGPERGREKVYGPFRVRPGVARSAQVAPVSAAAARFGGQR